MKEVKLNVWVKIPDGISNSELRYDIPYALKREIIYVKEAAAEVIEEVKE